MKRYIIPLTVALYIITLTQSQLKIPIVQRVNRPIINHLSSSHKLNEHSHYISNRFSDKNKPQHQLKTQQIHMKLNRQNEVPNYVSKLSHNVNFIRKRFEQNQLQHQIKQKNRNHFLRINSNDKTFPQPLLKLQTFRLEPNIYSFELPMKIGGYEYMMSIDSGSSDIFIKGQNSRGQPQERYQCGQVCIRNNQHYVIGYLDGRLKTYQTELEVKLGNHTFNQSILVAYQVQDNFKENQGLVGLSFPILASNPNPTFLQTLKQQGIINEYAFGVNLNFQEDDRSFITFGSYDPQFFQGQLKYFDLTSKYFYYISIKGVSIANNQIMPIPTAILDTGNTCISIPHHYQNQILEQFNSGQGQSQNKCYFSVQKHAQMFSVLRCKVGNLDALPTLNIHIGDDKFSIQKEFYLQACDYRPSQQDQQERFLQSLSSSRGDKFWYCDAYIQSVKGMGELFLGDGFFNRFYTYFDLEKHRVGMAKNRQIIQLKTIIQNQLDAESEDWLEILTKLNDQSEEDIMRQVGIQSKKNQGDLNIWDEIFSFFGF